ncbi:MAG: tetraacyldisaccharide 4'-kinase [Bacteroidia bacterium]
MKSALRILLFPLSLIYGFITRVRNFLYDSHLLKPTTFDDLKTICIGNLCVGGAGKTPHTEYILRLLGSDFNTASLSRGYGRKTTGYLEVTQNSIPEDSGDEPLQIKRKYPDTFVAVSENRVKGIKKLTAQNGNVDVIVLDDAFQHRAIKCGLTILLTEYDNPFYEDSMLPGGRLRESAHGYLRADIIVVTKTPEYATAIDLKRVMKEINPRPYQNMYFSYLKYGALFGMFDTREVINTPQRLFKYSVLLITGIANPNSILTYVKEYANSVVHKAYSDHHNFTPAEINEIIAAFNAIEDTNKIIITTEKDAIRLNTYAVNLKDLPIFVLPIEVDFKNKTEEFNEKITGYVRRNKIYHRKYT